jgi:murein DD-endopeptidase MepM/ murein hydrolase activator NlpD
MKTSVSPQTAGEAADAARWRESAAQLEALLTKQLLVASGAFKGSSVAGNSLTQDLFADTLAQAIGAAGGLGLSELLAKNGPAHFAARRDASNNLSALLARDPPVLPEARRDVSSGYGSRRDPLTGQPQFHPGVDLRAAEGTPIPAARDGIIVQAGARGGYGNVVEIAHRDGSTTLYAHAREVLVTPGDHVHTGDVIATVGQTGRTTGPHVHFEVRERGHPINPGAALKSYRLRAETPGGETP